jgi:hypothetical protein
MQPPSYEHVNVQKRRLLRLQKSDYNLHLLSRGVSDKNMKEGVDRILI